MTGEPALYTREFRRACVLHFTSAMSLALFLLFPLYIKALGGTEVTIGLVLGVGTAASVAARPFVGVLLDHAGRRRVLLWCGVANAVSWIPFFFLTTVGPALYFWVSVHEIVWGALFAAFFTYAADLAPPARRAEGIAVFGVAGMSANGLAPIVGERVIEASGYPAFFALAIAFALLGTVATLGVAARTTIHPHEDRPRLRDVGRLATHRDLATVLGATVVLGIAINAAYFFVAPFTRVLHVERTGPFFAAYAATSIVIRLFGRRTLDLMGPHRVSVPGFVAFALGLAGLAALPFALSASTLVLVACGIGCGAGHGSLFPVLNALAVGRGPASKQGAVVGLHTAALDFGAVVGTPLCGAVAQVLGYPAMYGATALASLGGVVLMARDGRAWRGGVA
ncbi:MAG TPA: MFS transporter [Candidatus Eisenbacteria bacterium]|nr:MFS transporter [Candidatus Eisenbacteria bacterium]